MNQVKSAKMLIWYSSKYVYLTKNEFDITILTVEAYFSSKVRVKIRNWNSGCVKRNKSNKKYIESALFEWLRKETTNYFP
jgi:hypothetical protein